MEHKWIPCSVSPGQFPTEFAVAGQQFNGKPFSLFAPRETVDAPASGTGAGWVRVEVVDRKGDLVLVRLPAQTFENGQHVTVRANDLQAGPPAQRATA